MISMRNGASSRRRPANLSRPVWGMGGVRERMLKRGPVRSKDPRGHTESSGGILTAENDGIPTFAASLQA